MDAYVAQRAVAGSVRNDSEGLARVAGIGLMALIWLVALVLTMSRASGAIRVAPETAVVWSIAVLFVLMATGARQLWRMQRRPSQHPLATIALDWAALPAMALALWAITPPSGEHRIAIIGCIAIVLVGEGWALRGYVRSLRRSSPEITSDSSTTIPRAALPESLDEESPSSDLGEQIRIDPPQTPAPHFPTDDVAQQLVRRVDEVGADIIQGWVRAVFEPRQRTASAHVAFCPVLEGSLSVEFEHAGGAEARIKAAQLLPYGVRFDVKLADPAERAESVLIEFVIQGDASLAQSRL